MTRRGLSSHGDDLERTFRSWESWLGEDFQAIEMENIGYDSKRTFEP